MSVNLVKNPEWASWESVVTSPYESTRVEHEICRGYFVYSAFVETARGKYLANGILREKKLITAPIFTPYYRVVDSNMNLIVFDKYICGPNNTVLVNFVTGEILSEGFSAYRYKDGVFIYRIDSEKGGMKWFELNLVDQEISFVGSSIL